jgi:hypothetical protein
MPPPVQDRKAHPSQPELKQMSQELLQQMFNQLDRDGDGKLSKSDLTTVATFEKLTPEEIDEVFKEVQPMVQPEDGTISFEEFSKAINVRDASALLRRLARSRPLERHVPAGPACVVGVDCQGSARPQPLLQGGGRHAPPGRRACKEHARRRRHVRRGAQGSQRVHDPLRSGHGGAHVPPCRARAPFQSFRQRCRSYPRPLPL